MAAGIVAVGLLAACSSSPPTPHTATLTAAVGPSSATLNVLTGTSVLMAGMADFAASRSPLRASTPPGGPPHLHEPTTKPGGSTVVNLSAPTILAPCCSNSR